MSQPGSVPPCGPMPLESARVKGLHSAFYIPNFITPEEEERILSKVAEDGARQLGPFLFQDYPSIGT
jgi:hypothetical protein